MTATTDAPNLLDPEVLRARLVDTAEGISRQIETFRADFERRKAGDEPWLADRSPEEMQDTSGRPILLDAYARLASALAAIAELDRAAGYQITVHNPPAMDATESVTAALAAEEERQAGIDARQALRDIRMALFELNQHDNTMQTAIVEEVRACAARATRDGALLTAIRARLNEHGYPSPSVVQAVETALHTAKQYREAYSHTSQISDHFRRALIAAVDALAVPAAVGPAGGLTQARRDAVAALDNPPAWDGVLR